MGLVRYLSQAFSSYRTVETEAYSQYLKPSSGFRYTVMGYQSKVVNTESDPDI